MTNNSSLSDDIRTLGKWLGVIIQEQNGTDAYELVEEIRAMSKARRSGDSAAAFQLARRLENLPLDSKNVLIKAFSNYFQLINIAEDLQRIRVIRQREAKNTLRESIANAIGGLRESGKTADDLRSLLEQARLRLVLTAHPSEAKRQEILVILRHIAQMMETRDRHNLLPRELRKLESNLAEEVEELWQTRQVRASKKQVSDEVDFGIYFIRSVIVDVVIDIYEDLQLALERYYPNEDWSELPPVLRYASWIGGDRDGNPNVTHRCYAADARDLAQYRARDLSGRDRSADAKPDTRHPTIWRNGGIASGNIGGPTIQEAIPGRSLPPDAGDHPRQA